MSADPNSFFESNFHAPNFQLAELFTSDYDRVGPNIHGNQLTGNHLNGLFINIKTAPGEALRELTVAGRWDDTDIVHIVSENLLINGTAGGALLDEVIPPVALVVLSTVAGRGTTFLDGETYNYRIVFVDLNSNEGPASNPTSDVVVTADGSAILLDNLPQAIGSFLGRRIYRSDAAGNGPYILVAEIDTTTRRFIDDGSSIGALLSIVPFSFRAR